VGLAGSSAIVTATFQCLMAFYGLTDRDIPKPLQPDFVLSVEMEELFIQAGLQDRVIQTYEGCMYMDFDKALIEERGYGEYVRLPVAHLPLLWLAYLSDPSNSGKIHSDVKARWKQGEPEVVEAMKTFAAYTEDGREALERKDWAALGKAMNANFALRRRVYGDACLGEANLAMVAIAQAEGMPVKFPGSGGAVVGMAETEEERDTIKAVYENRGYVFTKLEPHEPTGEES
jgi:glucuronokinase